ncbi:Nucleoside-diphosphate-sugar epimerase [Acinetobacter marinus]|uniref:Nucleoside-diphosphate-sugar epimerase n=1 Tax=Acinetobacter marinus TaxID=281375 RepID=A0A1G6NYH5_9GAMM|nr:NAD-dependent epimerase/dehydratase family protein [Acinetobacter marinus]SDC72768.1 Nucleoside-diphosphate-sugar epimerase [Acinetobacter marinus]
MNILILGCGQIGRALAEGLAQEGDGATHQVTCVSRSAQTFAQANIQHVAQDIQDLNFLNLDLSDQHGFDWVYVIVSPSERSVDGYQQIFIDSARPVFRALQHHPIQKVIFVSSTRVYGEDSGQWLNDETTPQTHDPIGQTLIAAEQLWSAYWQEKLTIIRPSGLYREHSLYLKTKALETTQLTTNHWTNRLHRSDLVGFLQYFMQIENVENIESSYILTDQRPSIQHELFNIIRAEHQFEPLTIHADAKTTGKRLRADRFTQSGYKLKYSAHPLLTKIIPTEPPL